MDKEETKDCMTFMGYKVQDMTRDGLLEVIKYQWWDKGLMEGKCEASPELDRDKIAQKETPLPRKEVISIQPGDVIVISVPTMLTESMLKMIRLKAQCQFPDNTVLVLDAGMTLEVYREQEKASVSQEQCTDDCTQCMITRCDFRKAANRGVSL